MKLFCLNGYNGEKISLELNEVIGFPDSTSMEGGYDIICTLIILAVEIAYIILYYVCLWRVYSIFDSFHK